VLLDAGADASVRMRDGSTALQLAAIVGLGSVVRMFARRGVDVGSELRGVDGVSPSILELVTELEEEAAAAAEPAPQAEDGDDAGAGGSEGSQPQRQLLEDVVGVPMGLGGGGLCAPLPVGALLAPGALDWARVPDSALRRVQAALASGLQAVADEAAAREERRRAEAEAARAEASRVGAVMRGLQGSCAPTYAELFARVGVTPVSETARSMTNRPTDKKAPRDCFGQELLEILAEDEDSWLDLWDGDLVGETNSLPKGMQLLDDRAWWGYAWLTTNVCVAQESVAEADRTSLIAVAPKILEVLAAAGDDSI
jgi:hypothetical protein